MAQYGSTIRRLYFCFPQFSVCFAEGRMKTCRKQTLSAAAGFSSLRHPTVADVTFDGSAFKDTPTLELLRASLVFSVCKVQPLVKHSLRLVRLSRRVLGDRLTYGLFRKTFFAHFCGGERADDLRKTVRALQNRGVGAILDYAVESEISQDEDKSEELGLAGKREGRAEEEAFKGNMKHTEYAVCKAAEQTKGFVAVKLSSLSTPEFLRRSSALIVCSRQLFELLAEAAGKQHRRLRDKTGEETEVSLELAEFVSASSKVIGVGEQEAACIFRRICQEDMQKRESQRLKKVGSSSYHAALSKDSSEPADGPKRETSPATTTTTSTSSSTTTTSTATASGGNVISSAVSVHSFMDFFSPDRIGKGEFSKWMIPSVHRCPAVCVCASSASAALDSDSSATAQPPPPLSDCEEETWKAVSLRLRHLCVLAASYSNVSLLVDAEQTYIQPAIDYLVLQEQSRCNADRAVVYNTYQAYLRDSLDRLLEHYSRSVVQSYRMGVKLVRGAYMVSERELATTLHYADPIHPSLSSTHLTYDACASYLLDRLHQVDLFICSHNENSVLKAVHILHKKGISPQAAPVGFAQLYGMCDHITLTLGREGFQAFKYLPYGPVSAVIPYLLRRAQENSSLLGASTKETKLMIQEVVRRLKAAVSSGSAHRPSSSASSSPPSSASIPFSSYTPSRLTSSPPSQSTGSRSSLAAAKLEEADSALSLPKKRLEAKQ